MRRLLLILLLFAAVASAQYTITTAAYASSDGSSVYQSFAIQYTPDCSSHFCPQINYTFSGSQRIGSSSGGSADCWFSGWTPADADYYTGCDVSMGMDGGDTSYDGYSTLDGMFTDAVFTPKIYQAHSAYKETGCAQVDQLTWACSVQAYGSGCPGTCTTASAKLVTPGRPEGYIQCIDTVIMGFCTLQLCGEQGSAGYCTSGPPN